jgi:hypothetical protein
MLGALMLNRVGREVDGGDIDTVDKAGRLEPMVELLKKLSEPRDFSDAVGNDAVLSFSAGPRDSRLALGGPRDKAAPKKNCVARGGASSVRTTGPISISVNNELSWSSPANDKTKVESALEILENPFGSNQMSLPGIMHM